VEWVVRGSRPIGIGLQSNLLEDFRREGLGFNVRPLDVPGGVALTPGSGGCACRINRPPHPNAARIYLDWFLSRDGQAAWNSGTNANSRRLDVEPSVPETFPKAGVNYLYIEKEQNQHLRAAAMDLARAALP
jgi:iron(III) transport system substrate-binding protein